MFKLDNDFLISLGLGGLPVEEKNKLLQVIYERLEMNVGMRLAEKMTDQQLDEFEAFIDRKDETGALHWLETNFPNYKDVVAEELEKLKAEVGASAPQILAVANQNSAAAQAQAAVPTSMPTQAPQMPAQPYQQPAPAPAQPPQFQPAPGFESPQPPAYQQPAPAPFVPPTQPPAGPATQY